MNRAADKKYSNEQYLEGIRNGHHSVLLSIYREFFPGVLRHVTANSGTRFDAEDLFDEALEVIFRKLQKENLTLSCSFYSFLFEICKRLWWKKLRGRKGVIHSTAADLETLVYDVDLNAELEAAEKTGLFWEKFSQLGDLCRQVLALFLEEEKSAEEVAAIMGYRSPGMARKKKYECKGRLIDLIREDRRYWELTNH